MGGLTVALALSKLLPMERIVYLGDTARVPYGTKSPDTVVKYARRNMEFMRRHDVKAVIVACNTVSAQGIDAFTQASDPLVLGVIEPGAKMACETTKSGRVGILATPGTVASQAYTHAVHRLDASIEVHQVACPLFVPLAEEGWGTHPATEIIAESYLSELKGSEVDTIILGCTHYPLLEEVISSVSARLLGSHTRIVNSADVIAGKVRRTLERLGLNATSRNEDHSFYATDVSSRSQVVAERFWQNPMSALPRFQHVDLPN